MNYYKQSLNLFFLYAKFMLPTYLGYALFYYFIDAKEFSYFIIMYCIIFIFLLHSIKKDYITISYGLNIIMILGSILLFYIVVKLWNYTSIGCLWFLQLPLVAKLFLPKKYFRYYNFYIASLLFLVIFLGDFLGTKSIYVNNGKMIKVLDVLGIVYNIFFISWSLHHHEKMSNQEYVYNEFGLENNIENDDFLEMEIENINEKGIDNIKTDEIFFEVKRIVETEKKFLNPNFTMFELSALLKVNGTYVSSSIKKNGFKNFSHYLNYCRINNVKKLIINTDFNKVTLMYLYTSSGFSNQATFNRVFKQFEGITPSEYVKKITKTNISEDNNSIKI